MPGYILKGAQKRESKTFNALARLFLATNVLGPNYKSTGLKIN